MSTNFWANFFLIAGFLGIFFSAYLIFQRQNPQRLTFENVQVQKTLRQNFADVKPAGIKIDSADISLPIIPSEIKNNKWEATTKGISYLKTSVIPGESGNSILYGHNWEGLLGNLKKVKPGEKISIMYSDGSIKEFSVEYSVEVKSDNEDILKNSEDARITLYTCSGFLDSKRLVVVAKLLV